LGSFVITKDGDQPDSSKIPDKIDMGLNLICIHRGELVPELVRSNQAYLNRMSRNRYFEYIDLSEEAVDLLKAYKAEVP
jgi:hypothetical protein